MRCSEEPTFWAASQRLFSPCATGLNHDLTACSTTAFCTAQPSRRRQRSCFARFLRTQARNESFHSFWRPFLRSSPLGALAQAAPGASSNAAAKRLLHSKNMYETRHGSDERASLRRPSCGGDRASSPRLTEKSLGSLASTGTPAAPSSDCAKALRTSYSCSSHGASQSSKATWYSATNGPNLDARTFVDDASSQPPTTPVVERPLKSTESRRPSQCDPVRRQLRSAAGFFAAGAVCGGSGGGGLESSKGLGSSNAIKSSSCENSGSPWSGVAPCRNATCTGGRGSERSFCRT
mmetsp:Transcript_3395/g.10270  ORF Transcript_3395/g.10270 Transcript_3395/m.10270 type:complete len:293 (-) Transcript_3395:347-1225(-)